MSRNSNERFLRKQFISTKTTGHKVLVKCEWIMKTTTTGRNNGIQWTLWTQLDDLDFADDLALLSHNHNRMQDKTTRLETISARTGLKTNTKKTELMKVNTTANTPVTVAGKPIKEVVSFVYLEVLWINREARTGLLQLGLARQGEHLSCSRTSEHPRLSAQEPNSASSIPT